MVMIPSHNIRYLYR